MYVCVCFYKYIYKLLFLYLWLLLCISFHSLKHLHSVSGVERSCPLGQLLPGVVRIIVKDAGVPSRVLGLVLDLV